MVFSDNGQDDGFPIGRRCGPRKIARMHGTTMHAFWLNADEEVVCSATMDTLGYFCLVQIINIVFNDFETEFCCDIVYLYDGETTKDPLIMSISGSDTAPNGYNSTQRYMLVRILTDATTTAKGFRATYTSIGLGLLYKSLCMQFMALFEINCVSATVV